MAEACFCVKSMDQSFVSEGLDAGNSFLRIYYYFMCVSFECMDVCVLWTGLMSTKAKRRHQILYNWSDRWLCCHVGAENWIPNLQQEQLGLSLEPPLTILYHAIFWSDELTCNSEA